MNTFLEVQLLDYRRQIDVDGGHLLISGVDAMFYVSLEVLQRATHWEESDQLHLTLALDDSAGVRWQTQATIFPSRLWLGHALDAIETHTALQKDDELSVWDSIFAQNALVRDVYEMRDTRMWKSYVIANRIIEVPEKYLQCWYDVAFWHDVMADGSTYASRFLYIRLRTASQYEALSPIEEPVYYRIDLLDIVRLHPFEREQPWRATSMLGRPQSGVIFRAYEQATQP